jgi:hypothetical protein
MQVKISRRSVFLWALVFVVIILVQPVSAGVQTIWIDPANGNDGNTGSSPAESLATISAGIDRIPKNSPLTQGYRIMLRPGNYPESSLPPDGYIEGITGTDQNPVTIEAAEGEHTAIIHGYLDFQKCSYLSLIDLDVVTDPGMGGGGNVLHLASDDHILIRGCTLNGYDGHVRQPQETLKANQVRMLDVEDSDISGSDWYSLDFVAVQGGHITGCRIHDAGEFALLIKGGSAEIRVEQNEIFNGRTGGISAGSGTGFDYFVSPYLHYDIYDTRFVNNLVYDNGIGISVNGGYNILVAHNTLYRNGNLLEVMHGRRGCEGDGTICEKNRRSGGWGTTGSEEEYIHSANVFVYNNIMYNPSGQGSPYQHFTVQGPVTPPANSNVPDPSLADRNLRIRGNLIWNGPQDLPVLGDSGGCLPGNTACNEQRLRTDNIINREEPRLVAPDTGDYAPESSGTVSDIPCYVIPPFPNDDRPKSPPVPQGNPDNTVRLDYYGNTRGDVCVRGAILSGTSGSHAFGSARSGTPRPTVQIPDTSPVFPGTTPSASLPESVCVAGFVIGLFILHNRQTRPR